MMISDMNRGQPEAIARRLCDYCHLNVWFQCINYGGSYPACVCRPCLNRLWSGLTRAQAGFITDFVDGGHGWYHRPLQQHNRLWPIGGPRPQPD